MTKSSTQPQNAQHATPSADTRRVVPRVEKFPTVQPKFTKESTSGEGEA